MTDLINVTKYHKLGFKGQGVKYIVLDGNFSGWCNLRAQGINIQSDGTVPDNDDTEWGHGTSMAAAFYEIAPEAEIYISNYGYAPGPLPVLFINWLQTKGITLVSQSRDENSYSPGRTFLEPLTDLEDCVNAGITVCTIAGNNAQKTVGFHLTKESGSNRMLFPNGTNHLDFISSRKDTSFRIDFVRSGSQRIHSEYTCTITNTRTGTIVTSNTIVSTHYGGDSLRDTKEIGDKYKLEITQVIDTSDSLDVLMLVSSLAFSFPFPDINEDYMKYSANRIGLSTKIIEVGAILVSDYNKRDVVSSVSGWGPIPEDVDDLGTVVVPYT
ncbi:MAG: hypothetical protein LBD57_04895, partial [Endomicrobium sp.]|uniref:hypothetical protein n=1 Tax=Candidatus Endomicrobiellum cubanum TaxID=3242325 RepID=UPI00282B427B|nr:hypothetical protein [Endomicrobium sp.]